MPQIEHVVVLMMENHSFDNMLGMVPPGAGRGGVDGFTLKHGQPVNVNLDAERPARCTRGRCPRPASSRPPRPGLERQPHLSCERRAQRRLREGLRGRSRWASGTTADLPFYYSLVRHFPIGDRYFCSVLGQTYPNRRFLIAGTPSGIVATTRQTLSATRRQRHDLRPARRARHHWSNYYTTCPPRSIVPGCLTPEHRTKRHQDRPVLHRRRRRARCPRFSFVDPDYEHRVGGEPPGHPGRRAVRREGRSTR